MFKKSLLAMTAAIAGACTTTPKLPPLEKVSAVNLDQFMGDWYVIANIPTFIEKGAHNAVEHYEFAKDGTIDITFTFRKDAFDGEPKKYTMTGTPVTGTNNAEWTVSPFWPIKFPYYTVELSTDYSWVVVATPNRDYLWIMARKPIVDEALLKSIIGRMVARGFQEADIQRVPQKW